jgi:hypothetical protein
VLPRKSELSRFGGQNIFGTRFGAGCTSALGSCPGSPAAPSDQTHHLAAGSAGSRRMAADRPRCAGGSCRRRFPTCIARTGPGGTRNGHLWRPQSLAYFLQGSTMKPRDNRAPAQPMLTIDEVARRLGLSQKTVRRWIERHGSSGSVNKTWSLL